MRSYRHLGPAVMLTAALTGCSSTPETASPTSDTPGPPAASPAVESTAPTTSVASTVTDTDPADTTVPASGGTEDGVGVGLVEVPCWWGGDNVSEVRCHEVSTSTIGTVAVAVIAGAEPDAAPILYVSGGPGFPTLDGIDEWVADLDRFDGRSVILFDQPGTGYSTPSLDCPERDPAIRRSYERAASFDTERNDLRDAIAVCRDRLAASGIDTAGYHSAGIAAVLDASRVELGIDDWHVVGTSYGTMLAMEIAAVGGAAVASLVLDGAYPSDRTGAAVFAERTVEGTRRVLAACTADPVCAAAYPDLDNRFTDMLTALDADPIRADAVTGDGATVPIEFTGSDALATLYFASWSTGTLPTIPLLVDGFTRRDPGIVAAVAAIGIDELGTLIEGTHYAIECADRGANLADDDLTAALANEPVAASALLAVHSYVTICGTWAATAAPLRSPDLLDRWSTPTLVTTGALDPVTPVEWGTDLADRLGAAHVIIPGRAHVNWASSDCTLDIITTFWAAPENPPDTTCLAELPAPAWITAS